MAKTKNPVKVAFCRIFVWHFVTILHVAYSLKNGAGFYIF